MTGRSWREERKQHRGGAGGRNVNNIGGGAGRRNVNNTGGGAGERNVNDGEELEEVNNRGEELEGGT